jgi:hypothetical protein
MDEWMDGRIEEKGKRMNNNGEKKIFKEKENFA